jgi:hypothetical protein
MNHPLKTSVLIAAIVLIVGVMSGWWQWKRLEYLEAEGRELAEEAARRGLVSADSPEASFGRSSKVHLRDRENKLREHAELVADLIAYAVESESELAGMAGRGRGLELSARIAALDAAGIRALVAALAAKADVPESLRSHTLAFALMVHAADHPAAAAAILVEHKGLMNDPWMRTMAVSSTMRHWGMVDPEGAARWLAANGEAHPEIAGDDAKRSLLSGIAANDPARAFGMLAGLRMDDVDGAVQAIIEAGMNDPTKRDGVFTALRAHAASLDDEVRRGEVLDEGFESLARSVKGGDFRVLSSWMDQAAFTADEKQRFVQGLGYSKTRQDTGRWVEWLAGSVPPAGLADPVSLLVGEWTHQDYRAAGEWLAKLPESPARAPAVEAYAGAVAEFEPAVAEQWALSLAPGDGREATLRAVHQNWPAADPDGARAFAARHGID